MKMKNWKYKFCLFKSYFDNGYSLTSPIKWGIGIFGASTLDVATTMTGFLIYLALCFFIGWAFIKFGFLEATQEVMNRHNLLAKELRSGKIFKHKKIE